MNYRIFPPDELLEADITLPLSKSLSNRVLIINALTEGAPDTVEVAACDDTDVTVRALSSDADCINIGAAGTAMRFLTAYFAATPGRTVTLDGSDRMRHRPIRELVDALRCCGAKIEYAGEEGFPPLRITGHKLVGGSITVNSSISSQYISALLMVAPTMQNGLEITLEGEVMSKPYINMTLGLMRQHGVEGEFVDKVITIPHGRYVPCSDKVEADWSAASYWYEIEALTSGWVTLHGLSNDSFQGDAKVASIYENLGVNTDYEGGEEETDGIALVASPDLSPRLVMDLSDTPDLAQTIVVTCAMIGVPFCLSGLASLKIKETDRLEALKTELLKVGIMVEIENNNTLVWDGARRPITSMPEFDTYDDHRMAMAFAPVSIYLPGIVVRNVEVVSKSYPEYWSDLVKAGFRLVDADAPMAEGTDAADSE